jgi:hypothetical protein
MQHISRGQVDLAQRLHDIADEIWEERNWIPRDRPLWVRLNDMAGELHRLATDAAQEIGLPSLATARSTENVLRFFRPGS